MAAYHRIHGLTRSALSALGLRMQAEKAAARLPDLLVAAEKAATAVRMGEHSQRRAGNGEKFWQFREYQTGDRPQDVDWRQSGRGDRVFVRQKEWQTTQTALLWCQRNDNMQYASRSILPTKFDAAATICMALGMLMMGAGEMVGTLDGSLRPGKGETALQNLGEKLLEPEESPLPRNLLREPVRHATIVLAGDFLSPLTDIEHALHALAGRSVNLLMLQTLDPAEINLPFRGRVIFETPHTGDKHHITNVDSVRDSYQKKMNAHIEGLKACCHHNGWHYVPHTTDTDIAATLFTLWGLIGQGRHGGALS